MTAESDILRSVMLRFGALPDMRIWRNNTGSAWIGKAASDDAGVVIRHPRRVTFGLPGSSDLIGIQRVTITPDMVGKEIGQFVGIEVKAEKGRLSKQQKNFQRMIERFGGLYIVVKSPDDVSKHIEGDRK